MANSKADLSFVLLFAFLLTSHVLAHDSPRNKHWYDDDGTVIIDRVNPTSSQDLEKNYWRDGSGKPSFRHFVGHGYETPRLEDVEKSTRPYNTKVDELRESDWTFPQAPRKNMFEARSSHHTHSTTYDPSNLKVNEMNTRPYKTEVDESEEPKRHWTFPQASRKTMLRARSSHNNTDSTTYNPSNLEVNALKKTRHRIHGRKTHPKPNFGRAFREFQARTYAKNYSDPKNYTDYSVTRHGNMERHASPEYCRAFREFQARTYGKVDFGVPVPEDFREETKN